MILYKLKQIGKIVLGRKNAAREIIKFPDDIFLVSYPKSGNTWVRFLVANLVSKEPVSFKNIEDLVPDIYQWSNSYLGSIKGRRILKSHEYFDPEYRRVIYIVRDPRDVAVSYWFHHLKFGKVSENSSLDEFTDRFIAGSLDPFGSWGENVGSWLGARENDPDLLMVRYEDLLKNSYDELLKISEFIHCDQSRKNLLEAIDSSNYETMKKMEKQQGNYWRALKRNPNRKDIPFVRSGKEGGWRNHLSENAARIIEEKWEGIMKKLGYLQ